VVRFDGDELSTTFEGSSYLTVVTQLHAAGVVEVTVRNPNLETSEPFPLVFSTDSGCRCIQRGHAVDPRDAVHAHAYIIFGVPAGDQKQGQEQTSDAQVLCSAGDHKDSWPMMISERRSVLNTA
jgi:hypothetical protein